jgi:cytochrome c
MDRVLSLACAALIVSSFAQAACAADPAHGKELFSAKCTLCHNADRDAGNKIGPNLFGVVGRPSGSMAGFSYSSAMKGAGVVWTPDKLVAYLAGPQKMIPGIRMTFPGFSNPADADDVVSYLSTLKAQPARTAAE